jgi:Protein of unknown function (DUF2510)
MRELPGADRRNLAMSSRPSPPAWYPDPARAHEWRYFDGDAWTDDVSDAGVVSKSPLGPVPAGRLGWATPDLVVRDSATTPRLVDVPRGKMWVLALLSIFLFWIRTPNHTIVLPVGFVFALWCWRTTQEALASHRAAGSRGAVEIRNARRVAAALALFGFLQAVLWTRLSG